MVKNRLDPREAMNTHHLFMIKRAIRLAKLGVPLGGYLT
jgi:hypothetical protein